MWASESVPSHKPTTLLNAYVRRLPAVWSLTSHVKDTISSVTFMVTLTLCIACYASSATRELDAAIDALPHDGEDESLVGVDEGWK